MDPQTTNQPNQPVTTPPQVSPVVSTQPAVPQPISPTPSGSKMPLIIASIVGGLLVVGGIIFALLFYPQIQAQNIATSFMSAVRDNNEQQMKDLSGDGRDGVTDRAHVGLSGATYSLKNTDKKESDFNVHFDIKDSKTLTGATVVVSAGKVTNFVLTSKSSDLTTTTQDSVTQTPTTGCLTTSDLQTEGFTGIDSLATNQTIKSFYFKADSSAYDDDGLASFAIKDIASLSSKFSSKQFTLTLRGSVNQDNQSADGDKLSSDRANKVKNDLIAKGVAASRIVIDQPTYGTMSNQEAYRTVTLFISAACSSSGQ